MSSSARRRAKWWPRSRWSSSNDEAAAGAEDDEEIGEALNRIGLQYAVTFDGQMTARLGREQRTQWLSRLRDAAGTVAATGKPRAIAWNGETVTVYPIRETPSAFFTGAATRARGWERTQRQLAGKATQLASQGGGWLRVDSIDGLFWASDWAHKPLSDRTAEMELLVSRAVGQLEPVHGVVLTSSACWAPDMRTCSWRTASGSYGLERPLPLGRARATFIVPLSSSALGGVRHWHDIYDSEPDWLGWALQACLPTAAEILS
jgi:hypothetical protein